MAEEKQNEKRKSAKEFLDKIEDGRESRYDFFSEKKEVKEKEISPEEKIIREEISRELQMMEQDENLKKESEGKAKQIQFLGEEEKIKHLLEIARKRGVAFAVKVARDMKDPYILDIFHDVLVREGLWKSFKE